MPQPRDCCTIELSGSFNLNWADYFQDMQVNEQVEQGTVRKTTLVGHPRDLEACLGILHLLVDRGFPVQSFMYRRATSSKAVVGDSRLRDSTDATPRPGAG